MTEDEVDYLCAYARMAGALAFKRVDADGDFYFAFPPYHGGFYTYEDALGTLEYELDKWKERQAKRDRR